MSDGSHNSVCKNIQETEDFIQKVLKRIETLEKELIKLPLVSEERERLEKEVAQIKKVVISDELKLRSLHSKNRQSFMIAVIIMFVGFLIFGLYKMIENS